MSATASPAASTCCVEGSPPCCAYDERFDRRPESSSTLRLPIIKFSPCSALSRIRPVQTWSPAVLLVAIRRRIPQDGVVLRWCGERGWKLRGSTGLASSILVAVVDFLGHTTCASNYELHTQTSHIGRPHQRAYAHLHVRHQRVGTAATWRCIVRWHARLSVCHQGVGLYYGMRLSRRCSGSHGGHHLKWHM